MMHRLANVKFGVCIVPTNQTFTTDLVTCIVMYVPLLISPELPNTEKADAQNRLQLTNLKRSSPTHIKLILLIYILFKFVYLLVCVLRTYILPMSLTL